MITLFRFFLEPSKEPVDKWSLSIKSFKKLNGVRRSPTYTFGDVFPAIVNYPQKIVDALNNATLADSANSDPAKGSDKTCAALKADSKSWFTAAFKKDPGYFK
jgi:hypothetical protein